MIALNKRNITIGVFVTLLLALGFQTYRANRLKELKLIAEGERDQALEVANLSTQKAEFYENKFGEEVAKTKIVELSFSNTNKLRESERLQFLKKFETLNRNLKNLQSATSIEMTVRKDSIPQKIITIPCESDSISAFYYHLKDEFNNIEAVVLDSPIFEIRVPVYTVDTWQRKKFLGLRIGRKEYFRETTSPNKLIKIESQKSFKVSKRRKR